MSSLSRLIPIEVVIRKDNCQFIDLGMRRGEGISPRPFYYGRISVPLNSPLKALPPFPF